MIPRRPGRPQEAPSEPHGRPMRGPRGALEGPKTTPGGPKTAYAVSTSIPNRIQNQCCVNVSSNLPPKRSRTRPPGPPGNPGGPQKGPQTGRRGPQVGPKVDIDVDIHSFRSYVFQNPEQRHNTDTSVTPTKEKLPQQVDITGSARHGKLSARNMISFVFYGHKKVVASYRLTA